jgi:hypothetical protein
MAGHMIWHQILNSKNRNTAWIITTAVVNIVTAVVIFTTVVVNKPGPGFYSHIFVVPKKQKSQKQLMTCHIAKLQVSCFIYRK